MNSLEKYIDTSEKAACFIYELNSKMGTIRNKLSIKDFNSILDTIKAASYKYYVVEDTTGPYKGGIKKGFKKYSTSNEKGTIEKGVYRILVNEIPPAEIVNNIVQFDSKSGRLTPTIRLLRDLA